MNERISMQSLIENPQEFITRAGNEAIFCYPTDSIYGLWAIITQKTVETIYTIKNRPRSKALSIIAPSFAWIDAHTSHAQPTETIWKKYQSAYPNRWLTLLCTYTPDSDLPLDLLTPNQKIWIRMIDHPMQTLITSLGEPFISTSANRSWHKPITDTDAVEDLLPDFSGTILTGLPPISKQPSVIIDLETEKILRS